jgi:hypothetical protein
MKGHVDHNMVLSDNQSVNLTATDEASTNQVRLPVDSVTSEYTGAGKPLWLNVMVTTTFAGGTSMAFELYDAADDGAGAPDTFAATGLQRSRTVANNQLDAKKKVWSVAIPPGTREWVELYLDHTGSMTAGAIDAWISDVPLTPID